jgi:hypothetical protein
MVEPECSHCLSPHCSISLQVFVTDNISRRRRCGRAGRGDAGCDPAPGSSGILFDEVRLNPRHIDDVPHPPGGWVPDNASAGPAPRDEHGGGVPAGLRYRYHAIVDPIATCAHDFFCILVARGGRLPDLPIGVPADEKSVDRQAMDG